MVKVAENRVVDLDLFPGNPQGEQLAQQARDAVQGKLPPEEAQGFLANTQGALGAVTGTLGGTLKGVVDTTGNTVGTLAQGLQGTVQGVGDGLGSTVQFAGSAMGSGVSQVGSYVTGAKGKGESGPGISSTATLESPATQSEREKAERKILPDGYKGPEDAQQRVSGSISSEKNP